MNKNYFCGIAFLLLTSLGPGGGEVGDCSSSEQKKESSCSGCGCGKSENRSKGRETSSGDFLTAGEEHSAMPLGPAPAKLASMRELNEPKPDWFMGRSVQVIKTVQVRRRWFIKRYVDNIQGANLEATALCNGWQWPLRNNPTLQPGQNLKVCGWK